jgi:anti-sigma regulatory factor (Ser/Thr protein kinase)
MAPEIPTLTLTLPSDLTWLRVARNFVEGVCHAGELDPADTRAIVLASNEAISNVIRHAHGGRADAQFQIECRLSPDRMEILLRDEGEPFDLANVPDLDPADIRPGGRGVYLMRALMDELTCEPWGNRGNLLRMVKRYSRKSD